MMKAWVVYESMFGNTRDVATAVADGMRGRVEVEQYEVGSAPPLPESIDLLVVGGPTHAFGMSRAKTRADAAQRGGSAVLSTGPGIREWLDDLPHPRGLPRYATFDTRVDHPRVPGSAARKAAKRLARMGIREAAPPESFWVKGMEGPLAPHELDRARDWGRRLTDVVTGPTAGQPVS